MFMRISSKKVKGKKYFYLEHSYRVNSEIKKKELYLGTLVPENIDELKEQLISEIYSEIYYSKFDRIKYNFNKEQKIMPKSAKEKELESFSTNFTYNTQRIEGSTLNLRETANLLEKGISPSQKPVRDVKEAEAHRDVFYDILKSKNMSLVTVLKWHKSLLFKTNPDIAGKIRNHGVRIAGATFIPPSPVELNPEIEDFYKWYNKVKNKINPLRLSALVHLKFVSIHPFSDGNGRTTRLMMNFVLKENNFPLMDIKYSKRNGYYSALERANVKNDPEAFVVWFFKRYLEEYSRYL